jgi:hypothetical protein
MTIAMVITSKSKLNVDISYYSLSEPLEKVLSIKHFICCPYNSLDGSHNELHNNFVQLNTQVCTIT